MEPNFLKSKELLYEILSRGVSDPGDAETRRKTLRALLHREKRERSLSSIKSPFSFEQDVLEIRVSLDDISNLLSGTEVLSTSLLRRLESRLAHLSARINRLDPDETQAEDKKALACEVLSLEGTFAALVSPPLDTLEDEVPDFPPRTSSPIKAPSTSFHHHHTPPKVYKWGISFSGSETPEQVFNFLDRIEELRIARGASKNDLLLSAVDIFTGNALIWFRSIKTRVTTWDELLEFLKREFLPTNLDFKIWEKIHNYKQNFSENCTIFIATMENMFSHLRSLPSESVRLDYIRHNLHPFYIKLLALHDITSVDQLSDLCRKLEDMKLDLYTSPPKFSKVSGPKPTSSGLCAVTCWNCRHQGHLYYDCEAPRNIFCFGCGLENVTQPCCPQCNQKKVSGATPLAVASTSASPAVEKGKRTAQYIPKKGNYRK